MTPRTLAAVLDANVLFSACLRDTLLRAVEEGLFQVSWSEHILTEVRRNLVKSGKATEEQADRLTSAMTAAFPDALVTNYEPLIASMPNDEQDRHVAAIAVTAGAGVIVTGNVKHFRALPAGIAARTPDDFLRGLFARDAARMVAILRAQAADLQRPPRTSEQLLTDLEKCAPGFAAVVRGFVRSPPEFPRVAP